MNLRILFAVHAILTFAAGVVLVVSPGAIPGAVGIHVEPGAYLLCYLLAAAEFGVSALSWGARRIKDTESQRIVIIAFIVWHAVSGLLEIYASAAGGLNVAIWANVAFRILVIALFTCYGFFTASSRR